MRTMQHVGVVESVGDGKAELVLNAPPGGEACGSCRACAATAMGGRRLTVERDGLKKGDAVRVTMTVPSAYVSALIVFVVPMAMFIAGMAVAGRFEPADGSGLVTLLGGLAGVVLAVAAAMTVNRQFTRRHPPAVERIDPGEAAAVCPAGAFGLPGDRPGSRAGDRPGGGSEERGV